MYMYIHVHASCNIHVHVHVLMRDEKKERKKQARSNKQTNKQTRQSNTAHPRQSLVHVYHFIHELQISMCILYFISMGKGRRLISPNYNVIFTFRFHTHLIFYNHFGVRCGFFHSAEVSEQKP